MNQKIFIHASEIATPIGRGAACHEQMKNLKIILDGAIVVEDGVIRKVGTTQEILQEFNGPYELVDLGKKAVIPGFVDSHTHFVFGGYRPEEFIMRLQGKSYMDIMNAGGGIAASVKMTREASETELYTSGLIRLMEMLAMGVTTVEGKSGYGLDLPTELRQLKVMKQLQATQPVDIVSTYLGAHTVPAEYKGRADQYITFMLEKVLPQIRRLELAEFCDVFCEEGVFSTEQSRKLLTEAKRMGFRLKMHADEIISLGGAELAAELGAVSADHLLAVSEQGISKLSEQGVVATLLPCTAFSLNKAYAPARKLIDRGVAVALATDFNPGSCFTSSIPLVIALACIHMGMSIEETITALTLNGAAALGRAESIGSIETGKRADFVVLKYPSYQFLVYHTAMNIVEKVVKNGEIVYGN